MDEAKERLFKIMDEIAVLDQRKKLQGLTEEEEIRLANLEVDKMNAYSDWKDPD